MPYWCSDCRSYFSVRTGTALERSKVPLRKWAIAIYLEITSLKSVSSTKLHRDIKVSQPTAWFMLHRLREAWSGGGDSNGSFSGPVEVDEAYFGGRRAPVSPRRFRSECGPRCQPPHDQKKESPTMLDCYTKAVLTVIAISLSVVAIQNIPSASAVGASGCGSEGNPCYITLAPNETLVILKNREVKGYIQRQPRQ